MAPGTDRNRLVPSSSDQILSGSEWILIGTAWNQLKSSRNHLEPTGSDWYLWGTVKYCSCPGPLLVPPPEMLLVQHLPYLVKVETL